jgi:hypothetical protein
MFVQHITHYGLTDVEIWLALCTDFLGFWIKVCLMASLYLVILIAVWGSSFSLCSWLFWTDLPLQDIFIRKYVSSLSHSEIPFITNSVSANHHIHSLLLAKMLFSEQLQTGPCYLSAIARFGSCAHPCVLSTTCSSSFLICWKLHFCSFTDFHNKIL